MADLSSVSTAQRVLRLEAKALHDLADRLNSTALDQAVGLIHHASGRLVVMGMGKSGHIARKLAATFASTGTPAYFVHPAEAQHGDLGMIQPGDVVMAISYSGETDEIRALLPHIRRLGASVIGLTGRQDSTLGRESDVCLEAAVAEEACPHNLAPTASTTAALALGDALAIAVLERRGFGPDDFARSHPGGSLGRRLLVRVSDLMHQREDLPTVHPEASLDDLLREMGRCRLGMAVVIDTTGQALGIFTDGDLRRRLLSGSIAPDTRARELMTPLGHSITPDALASEAAGRMDSLRVSQLLVCPADSRTLLGVISLHDLLDAKVI